MTGDVSDAKIRELQDRIRAWADRVFPHREPIHAITKLMLKELPELAMTGFEDPLEFGDVFILLFDICDMLDIDPIEAAHAKMDINERRQWELDPKTGTMQHVKK